jgi:hypothetical protein
MTNKHPDPLVTPILREKRVLKIQVDSNSSVLDSSKYVSDKSTTTLNPPSSILEDKSQEYIFNRSDSPFNESHPRSFPEESKNIVSQILNEAAHIARNDLQSSTKVNSPESSSMLTPTFETKIHNGIVQSSPEQESSVQKKFSPFTSDQIKHSSINTSSPNLINQFKNYATSINKNPYENLKPVQVHQESNDLSSIADSPNTGT